MKSGKRTGKDRIRNLAVVKEKAQKITKPRMYKITAREQYWTFDNRKVAETKAIELLEAGIWWMRLERED